MPKTREDFVPDVGGFLDGISGEIVDAIFDIASGEYADRVMAGGGDAKPPIVLQLTVESPSLEKPASQSYSVGSQDIWEIVDGGKAIQNIKNADKHSFRSGSRAYALVEAMMTALGDGDLEKGQDIIIKRDKYMTEAKFYIGFNFDWETQSLSTVGGAKSSVPLPSKFLGEAKKSGTATRKVATPTAEPSDLDTLLSDNASGKTEKELKSWAVRNPKIKADDGYIKAVVSGKKLRELENAGTLTLDPETKTYL